MKNKIQITLILLIAINFAVNAQIKAGATFLYGSEIGSLGIGAKGIYTINEKISASAEINHFFGKSEENAVVKISNSLTSLDLDAHYHFTISQVPKFDIYGIGGLNFSFIKVESELKTSNFQGFFGGNSTNDSKIGLNIGAGFLYPLINHLEVVTELTYTLSDFNQLVLQSGVVYTFGE